MERTFKRFLSKWSMPKPQTFQAPELRTGGLQGPLFVVERLKADIVSPKRMRL